MKEGLDWLIPKFMFKYIQLICLKSFTCSEYPMRIMTMKKKRQHLVAIYRCCIT